MPLSFIQNGPNSRKILTDQIFDNIFSFKSSIPKIAYDLVCDGQARGLHHRELGLVVEEQDPVADMDVEQQLVGHPML